MPKKKKDNQTIGHIPLFPVWGITESTCLNWTATANRF